MARFITTIQLHNAAEADYEKLNTELERASFKGIKKDRRLQKEAPAARREYNREVISLFTK